jgi:hypothetical protein
LLQDIITSFPVCFEFCIQKAGKENQLHNYKKDKNLYENYYPEFPANGHISETFVVEIENSFENIINHMDSV